MVLVMTEGKEKEIMPESLWYVADFRDGVWMYWSRIGWTEQKNLALLERDHHMAIANVPLDQRSPTTRPYVW